MGRLLLVLTFWARAALALDVVGLELGDLSGDGWALEGLHLTLPLGQEGTARAVAEIAQIADTLVCAYPNAGLPNPLSPTGFDLDPEDMARFLGRFADEGLLNLAGGNIHSVAINAAFLAARADSPVTMPLVLSAARDEFRKLERPAKDSDFAWHGNPETAR